jgi:low temperature requirement protein LtrA
MMRSRAGELLRKPGQPPRATFLELFFDLVFVFAFSRVSQGLVSDLASNRRSALTAAGETLVLLLAFLMVWFATAWVTDLYDPKKPEIQLVVAGAMLGSLLMGVAVPYAFGGGGLAFAGAYVVIHIGRGLILVPLLRGHEAQRRATGVLLWYAVGAVLWIAGAMVQDSPRGALWASAIVIEYTGAMLFYPAPWIPGMRAQWPVVSEYLSERYRQFFIIALGELILVAGVDYSTKHYGNGAHTIAFLVSFATTALLWRIYTYRAGQLLTVAIGRAAHPAGLIRRTLAAHLLMVVGIIAIAAGYGLVIDHPLGHTDPAWLTVILGGPALFIVGRASLQRTVFGHISRDRFIGLLVLAALAPVMLFLPPLAAASAAMAVLAGMAIADAARDRQHPAVPPSPHAAGPS